MSFVHLQVRSGYSLFESTNTIEKLVQKAHEQNFQALALTDEHVLHGVISFYQKCIDLGIKPIIGMSVNVLMDDQEHEPCILLAKNNQGYKQLINLSTYINVNQTEISFSQLHTYTNDIVCILPASTSKLAKMLIKQTSHDAMQYISEWQSLFNDGDFYLGIQDHGQHSDRIVHRPLMDFYKITDIPVVAIQDVRYLEEEDVAAFDCLQAMKAGTRWSIGEVDVNRKYRHLRSAEEMEHIFASFWPAVLKETKNIANKCNVSINLTDRFMPTYPVPDGNDAYSYLSQICWDQAKAKYGEITDVIKERLTYELDTIKTMKFSDYFLIVWDFISFAKENDILVGPGRGSSASSIVAYVLGITEVDPLKHDLLFERFLNPERVTMPDIDIDFSDHRRDEVIHYVRDKYGEEHVAQIITFGTFAPRSVLRELIKTMGIDEQDTQFIMRHIPAQGSRSIRHYVRQSKELKDYIKQSERLQRLFSLASKLEGLPRHISTHAAGMIISDDVLTEYTPLTIGSNDTKLTQFAMNELESIGLLKIDLLGLRNLSLIERIIQTIYFHLKKQINLQQIPSQDEQTFKLLQQGKTNGVFQLESSGMKQVLQRLKPSTFGDIVAVNALYRPGPMEYIPVYIKRKHGKEQIVYPHEDLEEILKPTFGVLVYQEQIMQIAHQIAGLTYGEADLLRRAISKKQTNIMQEQKEKFIKGCLKNGYQQSVAEEIFTWILKFSKYGFPKSHATAYSKISYKLAYLKAHYPAFFFAELLSSVMNQQEKTNEYIKEARNMNISILSPSINYSIGKYTVRNNSIQMGLLAIKGIGYQTVKEIITARKAGPFKNLFDFCLRVSLKIVNRSTIEKLILAGAFDESYSNRASLLASIEQAMEQGILFGEFTDQSSLFQHDIQLKPAYIEIDDFTQIQKLTNEKELLGIYLSSHPLSEYRARLQASNFSPIVELDNYIGKKVRCAGIIQSVKSIRTRRGDPMAFMTLSDETADINGVVFPDVYRNERRWIKEEMVVFITGKVEVRNHRLQIIVETIQSFDQEQLVKETKERLFIKITESNQDILNTIQQVSTEYNGNVPIIVYNEVEKKSYQLSDKYNLNPKQACIQLLQSHFGVGNVVLQK